MERVGGGVVAYPGDIGTAAEVGCAVGTVDKIFGVILGNNGITLKVILVAGEFARLGDSLRAFAVLCNYLEAVFADFIARETNAPNRLSVVIGMIIVVAGACCHKNLVLINLCGHHGCVIKGGNSNLLAAGVGNDTVNLNLIGVKRVFPRAEDIKIYLHFVKAGNAFRFKLDILDNGSFRRA